MASLNAAVWLSRVTQSSGTYAANSILSFASSMLLLCSSSSARLYSVGNTLTNLLRLLAQSSSRLRARVEPVCLKWRSIRRFRIVSSDSR